MGEDMRKKYNKILSIIMPNKKTNLFVIIIIIVGLTAGAIFSNILSMNDNKLVIEKITTFIDNINTGNIDSMQVLKNALSINLLYTMLIWLFGMSLIGIFIVYGLLFLKNFIYGFTISSFIITFKVKGIILSILYLLFGELLNIIALLLLTIYATNFTIKLLKTIFKNNNNSELKHFLKNYSIILLFVIIINIISSLSEAFILPSFIKLIIKLFI